MSLGHPQRPRYGHDSLRPCGRRETEHAGPARRPRREFLTRLRTGENPADMYGQRSQEARCYEGGLTWNIDSKILDRLDWRFKQLRNESDDTVIPTYIIYDMIEYGTVVHLTSLPYSSVLACRTTGLLHKTRVVAPPKYVGLIVGSPASSMKLH